MKKYLISVEDSGTTHFLVDEDIFEWVHSDMPNFLDYHNNSSGYETGIPAKLVEWQTEYNRTHPRYADNNPNEVYVTVGSYENDRVLAIMCACPDSFDSTRELMKYCSENNIEIVEESSDWVTY